VVVERAATFAPRIGWPRPCRGHLIDALDQLRRNRPLRQLFGDDFVEALIMVEETELKAYQGVISSWEREHLLLNV
jgi:glutamine synthetase